MNKETLSLTMTTGEGDSLAYVLMSALQVVTMTSRERSVTTDGANALFLKLGYRHGTTEYGTRVEWSE